MRQFISQSSHLNWPLSFQNIFIFWLVEKKFYFIMLISLEGKL